MLQPPLGTKDSTSSCWWPVSRSLGTERSGCGDLSKTCGTYKTALRSLTQQPKCAGLPFQPAQPALNRDSTGSMEDDEDCCLMESATCTHSSVNLSAASRLLGVPTATTVASEEVDPDMSPCAVVLAAVAPSPSPSVSLAVKAPPPSPATSLAAKPPSPSAATSLLIKPITSAPVSPKSSRAASADTPSAGCEQVKQEIQAGDGGALACLVLPEPDEVAASLLRPEAWAAAAAVPHGAGTIQGPAKTKGRTVTGRRKCTTERNRDKVHSLQNAAVSASTAALALLRHNMWLCVRVRVMEAFVQIRDDQMVLLQHMDKLRQHQLQPVAGASQPIVMLEGVPLSSQEVQAVQHTSLPQFLTSVRDLTADAVRTMGAYMGGNGMSLHGQQPPRQRPPVAFHEGMSVVDQPDDDWEAVIRTGGRQHSSMERLEHLLRHIQRSQPLTWHQTTLYKLTKSVTRTLATVMRAVAMTQPHLFIQLTALNLETGTEQRAPAEHWERVVSATALRPQQLLELRMALQVYREVCAKIKARHADILQEYQQRVLPQHVQDSPTAPHHPTPAAAWTNSYAHDTCPLAALFADGDGPDFHADWLPAEWLHGGSSHEAGAQVAAEGSWIMRLSRADQLALCQELATLGRQQQSIYQLVASFIFGRMMTPFQVVCCKVQAWPYLPDPLAMEEVILREHTAGSHADAQLHAEHEALLSTLSPSQAVLGNASQKPEAATKLGVSQGCPKRPRTGKNKD